jgi:hypothetical protein
VVGLLVTALVLGVASANYTLRYQPPLGYCQDLSVTVKGNADARGDHVDFAGTMEITQTVTEVPQDPTKPLKVRFVINSGEIRYNDKNKPPRYIGTPFSAVRTRLGVITDVSAPLTDDQQTGIDVTAAVLYSTSLLAFSERPTSPGKEWDGSHDAFDPYGDYVPVTATNSFADLEEMRDSTQIKVQSNGSFPYRAKLDDKNIEGKMNFLLDMQLDLDTGTLLVADLDLHGSLKANGPLGAHVNVHVNKLYVHVEQKSARIVDVSKPDTKPDAAGSGAPQPRQ